MPAPFIFAAAAALGALAGTKISQEIKRRRRKNNPKPDHREGWEFTQGPEDADVVEPPPFRVYVVTTVELHADLEGSRHWRDFARNNSCFRIHHNGSTVKNSSRKLPPALFRYDNEAKQAANHVSITEPWQNVFIYQIEDGVIRLDCSIASSFSEGRPRGYEEIHRETESWRGKVIDLLDALQDREHVSYGRRYSGPDEDEDLELEN